ncbi:methyltransferase domain protein [Rhizodiscina lignyota]|uniref:Methyltransferase domain protein n=1 Tax=Rhizodiscina lignyota TaxID=1504668 RepID=A0A9P4I710_9PEZI|nr:methyltransferase domain protein [Rhizodiscina lignyota]
MSQNVYDREEFFAEYSKLPRSQGGLEATPEWPQLCCMVGDISGSSVLDLGCGYGWFCRWAKDAGVTSVCGIDLSTKMLARAKDFGSDNAITYSQGDLETIQLYEEQYRLVYSSLALHYLHDLRRLVREVYRSLYAGGKFVFSVEHPIWTAPMSKSPSFQEIAEDPDGRAIWPLNGYADEGPRLKNWLAGDVQKYHRKIDTYISTLLDVGFTLTGIVEYTPTLAEIEEKPQWKNERERPLFLLLAAKKR